MTNDEGPSTPIRERSDTGRVAQRHLPGLIGMAPRTNAVYYRLLDQVAGTVLPDATLRSVLYTINFKAALDDVRSDDWAALADRTVEAADALVRAGSDLLAITSNTGHAVLSDVSKRVPVAFVDIVASAISELARLGCGSPGLLSTRAAARSQMYQERCRSSGMDAHMPDSDTGHRVDQVIFGELVNGSTSREGIVIVQAAIDKLVADGADSVLLACTDFTHVSAELSAPVPIVDTTRVHVADIAQQALGISEQC